MVRPLHTSIPALLTRCMAAPTSMVPSISSTLTSCRPVAVMTKRFTARCSAVPTRHPSTTTSSRPLDAAWVRLANSTAAPTWLPSVSMTKANRRPTSRSTSMAVSMIECSVARKAVLLTALKPLFQPTSTAMLPSISMEVRSAMPLAVPTNWVASRVLSPSTCLTLK